MKIALFVQKSEDKWAKNEAKIALFDLIYELFLGALFGILTVNYALLGQKSND